MINHFNGFSKIIHMNVDYFECPKCKHQHDGYIKIKNNNFICSKCDLYFKEENIVSKKEKGVVCSNCDEKISISSVNECGGEFKTYLCYKCGNIVAIKYKDKLFSPKDLLSKDFNKKNIKKSIKISNNLKLIYCDNKNKDLMIVLNIMNHIAREENSYFNRFRENYQKAIILYDNFNPIGYIIWSEKKDEIIIRQIFILKEYRGNLFSIQLFKSWIENFVKNRYDNYGIESPNRIMSKILYKYNCFGYPNAFLTN